MSLTNQGATKLGATHFCDHPVISLTGGHPWEGHPWIDCLRCEASSQLPITWSIRSGITARKNEPAD